MTEPRSSGRDRALRHLREVVLTDPGVAGTFLNEQQIATRIGVSRTPVREALLTLAAEGLVQMVPKRGAWVAPMSPREITELMDLRLVLERHAVETALSRRSHPELAMGQVLAQQADLARDRAADQVAGFIELDRRFHQALIDAAGSDLLSRTYAGLRERQLRVGIAAMASDTRWHQVCAEHGEIVAALEAGDRDAALAAVSRHLALTRDSLLAV